MGEAHEEIRAAGGDVVAVFQYRADPRSTSAASAACRSTASAIPSARGTTPSGSSAVAPAEYIGPQLAKGFLRAARHGDVAGNPQGGDVAQRPGTFVVSPEGRVLYAHYNQDSADNPPVNDVLAAIRSYAPSA